MKELRKKIDYHTVMETVVQVWVFLKPIMKRNSESHHLLQVHNNAGLHEYSHSGGIKRFLECD